MSWVTRLFRRGRRGTVRNTRPAPARLALERLTDRDLPAAGATATFDYADRVLRVEGTDQADQIRIVNASGQVVSVGHPITVRDGARSYSTNLLNAGDIVLAEVHARGGDDLVEMTEMDVTAATALPLRALGGAGHDTLVGGTARDELYGGFGNDVLHGLGGNDRLEAGYSVNETEPLAADFDRQFGLYATDNVWQNSRGLGEKWVAGVGSQWFYILPNGGFYRASGARGEFLWTLNATYHTDVFRLVNAHDLFEAPEDPFGAVASEADREHGLYAGETLSENWGGQGEKWLAGRDGWYFVLSDGSLHRWDGSDRAAGDGGSLRDLHGAVVVTAPDGGVEVVADNSGDATPRWATIVNEVSPDGAFDYAWVSGPAPAPLSFDVGAGSSVAVRGGTGGDRFSVVNPAGRVGISVDAGAGTDTLDYTAFADGVTVDLGAGTATALAVIAGFENVLGGVGPDVLVGDDREPDGLGGEGDADWFLAPPIVIDDPEDGELFG